VSAEHHRADRRIPVCYLAPWVDYGGSDKGTIDWFRWLDRDRFAPFLVTTQPSANRRLREIYRYAEEVWPLPEFLGGQNFPAFIFDLIHSRGIEVLHIMNSRLGYDLLPDLASLPNPPRVVVQLHVEEPDRSGFVRYVTTRYGNLVDAFSVSSEHLARAVQDYRISPSKVRVIPTGVDADAEFNPKRVLPVDTVDRDRFNILYPGRLTDQKDPFLMVDVIRHVVREHRDVQVHVVGDGPLGADVRARVRDAGLDRHVSFHPPSRELARWYASCDLLLMTSVFEGVPYVIYEAMAMELPIVAPALPGNVELMADTGGVLVDHTDLAGYVSAVSALIDDRSKAAELGRGGRKRVADRFGVRSMASLHGDLYQDLLDRRAAAKSETAAAAKAIDVPLWPRQLYGYERAPALRLSKRPMQGNPLVSVIVPCFNHGQFLEGCIDSVLEQGYEPIEVIVVDDASTDETTINALTEIESRTGVSVIRLAHNSGPSAARNAAISRARGRYVLPLDTDNLLLPGALASLVGQLQTAGELVGYIYPNCQYFGTRDDYFEPPSFNLALLLAGNFCDTCSLIDREIFDAGILYPDDIGLGHEDWDFVLTLAEHGVRGEPARDKTLLYRKHGFTRSDAVEYGSRSFHEEIDRRHPSLFGGPEKRGRFGPWWGPAAEIKARYAPGLTILLTTEIDFSTEAGMALLRGLQAQSCGDLELIAECPATPPGSVRHLLKRIPSGLCANECELVREGLQLVRAPRVLLAGKELVEMLGEPSFVERLQRTFWAIPTLEAIAFTDAGHDGRFPYRLLEDREISGPAHALAWRTGAQGKLPAAVLLKQGLIAESLARAMSVRSVEMQWRHVVSYPTPPGVAGGAEAWVDIASRQRDPDPHRRIEQKMVAKLEPAVPALRDDSVRRWLGAQSWMPPETQLLTRHREIGGERRVIRLGRESPPGYSLEYDLGAIQRFAPPGTVRLVNGESGLRTVPRGSVRLQDDEELGHLELAPLPLFQAVERVELATGGETLAAGELDFIKLAAVRRDFLGFIEPFPSKPTTPPDARRSFHGQVGLLRLIDRTARRHLYTVDPAQDGTLIGELGALHLTAEADSVPLRVDQDGWVTTSVYAPGVEHPSTRGLLRWAVAPVGWRGFGHLHGRARAVAGRGLETRRRLLPFGRGAQAGRRRSPGSVGDGRLLGYLYPGAAPGRLELFSAIHPLTGDQLLTKFALEAADMGYGEAISLGFVLEQAPVTGTFALERVSVPWASRFGLEVRRT
jgi:glycosyltransferase involved in cell wall biosynthesis